MRRKISRYKLLVFLLLGLQSVQAQDKQVRVIFHPTLDLSSNWYLTGWIIGNAKTQTPQNLNFFLGTGYRNKDCSCWLDSMIQKQYSEAGNNWLLDFRFQKKFKSGTILYAEPAPFLNKRALYDFIYVETPLQGKFRMGVETENVHRPGPDSIGAGPRISYPLQSWERARLDLAVSYQIRRAEPNVLRLYLIIGKNF